MRVWPHPWSHLGEFEPTQFASSGHFTTYDALVIRRQGTGGGNVGEEVVCRRLRKSAEADRIVLAAHPFTLGQHRFEERGALA